MEKCLLKRPAKISFKLGGSTQDSLSHRRRSNVNLDESVMVVIDDLKLGE